MNKLKKKTEKILENNKNEINFDVFLYKNTTYMQLVL